MKKLFYRAVMILACAGALLAQDRVQRVITIKNGNIGGITRTIHDLLAGTNVAVSQDNEHIVLSGPKDTVTGFEEIIKQLDVPAPPATPKKNVETTVYMIIASAQPGTGTLPPGLEPVVTQLKSVFSYKGFRVLESFILRSRSGERGETNGFLPSPDPNVPANAKTRYGFAYNRVVVDGSPDALVRYDALQLHMTVPVSNSKGEFNMVDASIATNVDVPAGKKVVIGKTSAVEGPDSALILVISAKVVD